MEEIGYVKNSLGNSKSQGLSGGIMRKRGFVYAKTRNGEIRKIACIYPVGRFWEMLTSFVDKDNIKKSLQGQMFFCFCIQI